MAELPPDVVVLAGPNGAGKSTAADAILRDALGITEFVNADVIAQGLSGFDPECAAMAAGRIMLERLHELARRRWSFAFETTLASRSFAPWLAGLIRAGYRFHLVFLRLPSPDLSVARVAARVLAGGHHVPEPTIRRRYEAGLRNLSELYQPMATTCTLCDNPGAPGSEPLPVEGPIPSRCQQRDLRPIMPDPDLVEQALRRAVVQEMSRHKRLGNLIVVWRDGKVVWVPAEEIQIPDEVTDSKP